jgi:MOSC domain-containing protein YiiM
MTTDTASPDALATIVSVNISGGGIPKLPVAEADVTAAGLDGDAHDHEKHNTPVQAISLIDLEDLEDLRGEGFAVGPGATGENVTVRGLGVDALDLGDRLRLSGGVTLEVTKMRKPCYVLDAIDPELKKAIVGRCGAYARVLEGGRVRPGETIAVEKADA